MLTRNKTLQALMEPGAGITGKAESRRSWGGGACESQRAMLGQKQQAAGRPVFSLLCPQPGGDTVVTQAGVSACGLTSYGMWDLSPPPGTEPMCPALRGVSLVKGHAMTHLYCSAN